MMWKSYPFVWVQLLQMLDELNVGDILAETEHKANDAARLDDEGEICVSIVKEVIENKIKELELD